MKASEIFEGENSSLKQAFDNTTTMRERYVHKFCNDHNGKIRWLRGIFMDDEDAIESHLDFIEQELKKEREEIVEILESWNEKEEGISDNRWLHARTINSVIEDIINTIKNRV